MTEALIAALQQALALDPSNVELRVHLCEMQLDAGQPDAALAELRTGLAMSPSDHRLLTSAVRAASDLGLGDEAATYLTRLEEVRRSSDSNAVPPVPALAPPPWHEPGYVQRPPDFEEFTEGFKAPPEEAEEERASEEAASTNDTGAGDNTTQPPTVEEAGDPVSPAAVSGPDSVGDLLEIWATSQASDFPEIGELENVDVTLDDVGGMAHVKQRLHSSFLTPMRNPEMRELFGKSMRGGLLLWGPPGCGKSYIARAVAGELGASFYHVGASDVLDMWMGRSERNITRIWETARKNAPCVLFLDEIDALGHKRTGLRAGGSALRGVVNQLLQEMDGASSDNEGVFVLAATNHPWDIDSALLRPGRLDRMLLVLPPDEPARESIVRLHLRHKPASGIDFAHAARLTMDFTGADLALVCEQATEFAMLDSIESGTVRPIGMADLIRAIEEIRPSHGPWFESAKNYSLFNNESGMYDELLAWVKARRNVQ